MKRMKYISMLICSLLLMTACEKETEGISGILSFELKGGDTYLSTLGEAYTDPGYRVTYKGEDVTNQIAVSGEVDPNTVGLYYISYIYTNPDGIKTTRTREVIVADPTVETDIAGTYLVMPGSQRLRAGVVTPYNGYNVIVQRIAPGFFSVTDFLGGYYDKRAGYGSMYACAGYIQLKSDNSITLLSSKVPGWDDSLSELANTACDPAAGTLSWDAHYANMIFTVILNKQ